MVVAIEWGPVSSWFVVGSVLVAASTFWAARRDAVRAQASKVYGVDSGDRFSTGGPNEFMVVGVWNRSDGPIFDIHVFLYRYGGRRRRTWRWRSRNPYLWLTSEYVQRAAGFGADVFGPEVEVPPLDAGLQARVAFGDPGRPVVKPDEPLDSSGYIAPVVVTFTDGNGRRWVRWPDGRLSRR
jgi:hypothetical protein